MTPENSKPFVSLILLLPALALAGCRRMESFHYATPAQADDGWETSSVGNEHLAIEPIKQLFDRIADDTYKNTHSVLIVKNDKLIVEEYFSGYNSNGHFQKYDRDKLHELCSISKSVNSISIGIAIDQHLISGVNEKISTLLPAYGKIFADNGKDAIRLVDLLTMRAGLSWDEWTYPYEDPRNDHVAMDNSKDPVEYVLTRPLANKPGVKFAYSSGITLALGEVVHQPSGEKADKFAEHYLFKPLGISKYYWSNYPSGFVRTGGGLALRPRDMAKIGQLFLDGGRWKGKQVVSEEWVKASTTNYIDAKQFPDWIAADGYGYQWWLRSFKVGDRIIPSFHAAGRGGQFIFVFPDLKMVAVFTGWNDNELSKQPFEMVERYVLPAALASPTTN
jgi:CubicO group peptidase (beta-lactamase class C family)